jgi:threonine synthase
MQLYSTNNPATRVDLKTAIFQGLPEDKGLFMPLEIPQLPPAFFQMLPDLSFQELSFQVARHLIGSDIPADDLEKIIYTALNFPAPVVSLDQQRHILELFHGPSLAFKDFGARFMAQTMSYFNRHDDRELTILVATSGDTGGAVAAGFYQTPGIRVIILYPSGKVSHLQEQQLTTLGHNISAIEVLGTFDDCQALVKQAFLDPDLQQRFRLSSANSINIARLIPQSFYYFESFKQLMQKGIEAPVVYSVPSGNFGNLTAGLFAKRMNLPIHHFIAATNNNDVVPQYLNTGTYTPRPSVRTLSNAMDVGAPSNFVRMMDLYGSTWNIIKQDISGYGFNDAQTEKAMQEVFHHYNYLIDPHAATGYLALNQHLERHPNHAGIILETAHPAKFLEDTERILSINVPIPQRLAEIADKTKNSILCDNTFQAFKQTLLDI